MPARQANGGRHSNLTDYDGSRVTPGSTILGNSIVELRSGYQLQSKFKFWANPWDPRPIIGLQLDINGTTCPSDAQQFRNLSIISIKRFLCIGHTSAVRVLRTNIRGSQKRQRGKRFKDEITFSYVVCRYFYANLNLSLPSDIYFRRNHLH